MNKHLTHTKTQYDIPRADIDGLIGYGQAVAIPKGTRLVECGGFNDSFYIISDGILRAFRSPGNTDLTLWFALPGDVIVNMFCYCAKAKSPIGIEAETDVQAIVVCKERIEQACESSLRVANAVRHIFERHALEFEDNILSLWACDDGTERYSSILKRHPEILQYVPLKKLASYLQVTPQSLSRIRANL